MRFTKARVGVAWQTLIIQHNYNYSLRYGNLITQTNQQHSGLLKVLVSYLCLSIHRCSPPGLLCAASDDPRTLAWPPYHPWLRVGPLLVRAGGRRLAAGGVAPRTFSIRGAPYQDTIHTSTGVLTGVRKIQNDGWPPYHPWLRVGPLLVRAGGRRLAAGGVARFPYVRGASYSYVVTY